MPDFELTPANIAWIVAVLTIVLGLGLSTPFPILGILLFWTGFFTGITAALLGANEAQKKKAKLEAEVKTKCLNKFAQLKLQFNERTAREILEELKKVNPGFSSQQIYDSSLDLVTTHIGNPQAKVFALEVGRWHYSLQRLDRKPTIYDEQAIQNDINTRS